MYWRMPKTFPIQCWLNNTELRLPSKHYVCFSAILDLADVSSGAYVGIVSKVQTSGWEDAHLYPLLKPPKKSFPMAVSQETADVHKDVAMDPAYAQE